MKKIFTKGMLQPERNHYLVAHMKMLGRPLHQNPRSCCSSHQVAPPLGHKSRHLYNLLMRDPRAFSYHANSGLATVHVGAPSLRRIRRRITRIIYLRVLIGDVGICTGNTQCNLRLWHRICVSDCMLQWNVLKIRVEFPVLEGCSDLAITCRGSALLLGM